MITDWLRAPDVWVLTPLVAGLVCALALTLTRRWLPPERPLWLICRALVICAALSAVYGVATARMPKSGGAAVLVCFSSHGSLSTLHMVSRLVGCGLILGTLIPCLIEGRSLAQMGWRWRRAGWYAVGGLAAGLLLATAAPGPGPPPDLAEALSLRPERGWALVPMLPVSFVAACAAFGLLAGWSEENVFRGHLMPALASAGLSPRWANVLQAVVFAFYHVPAHAVAGTPADYAGPAWALVVAWLIVFGLWGLLFGFLRQRTGSIVPGFALHTSSNAMRYVFRHGPLAVMVARLHG